MALLSLLGARSLAFLAVTVILAAGMISIVAIPSARPFRSPGPHRLTQTDVALQLQGLDFSASQQHREYYASAAAGEFCAAHGYTVFTPRSEFGQRKVYDLFMVNTELDFLEIRLRTLYDLVDFFVIVESPRTFQGRPKPLTVRDSWSRFQEFHDKMIYHLLEFPDGFKPKLTWDYENLQRDAAMEQVLERLSGPRAPVDGDVLVVADVDEIPRPSALLLLRTCHFPRRLTLESQFYYYSFQFRHRGSDWPHPQATYYEGARTLRPSQLRSGSGSGSAGGGRGAGLWLGGSETGTLGNAAWHCSSCFATVTQFLNKMASFSHVWMNEAQYRDRDRIASAVRAGRDIWDRPSEVFERIESNTDVPTVLQGEEGRRRFRYMLDRDGERAGFSDYP